MEFEYTWKLLHLLWIVPLFGLLVYIASYRRKKVLEKIFGANSESSSNSTLSLGKRYLRLWLLFAAVILICIAIARPNWGWRILPFSGRGRDLMVVLDVSKSMKSEDVKPTRLMHAKLFLRNLIKDNPGDRFGLVAFAGSAFLECPLTVDKTSIFQCLDEINTNTIPLGGTNIETALNTALQAFKAAEGGYRAIVLITDGDELYGNSSRTIAEMKRLKIPLFVVGIGDPSGDGLIKMTGPDGKIQLMRDPQGNLIKSKLNEAQLSKLATDTGNGSIYVRSTETNPELGPINRKIERLVPKEYTKGSNKRPIERFHYPLFAAVILLLIRFGVGERKKLNKSLILIGCFFFVGLSSSVSAQQPNTKPKPELLELAEEMPEPAPEDNATNDKLNPVDLYNMALKKHTENKSKEAEALYKQAINMAAVAPEVRSKAFQNLGVLSHENSRAVMQQDPDKALKILDQAEEMYKESMRSDTKRKRVVLNQQKLLDDRELAKQIKKHKEELKNKQKQAQKKTKEALDQQKKENQKNKENKDKKDQKQDQKPKGQKQENKDQKQGQQQDQRNKNTQGKGDKNKKDGNKSENKNQSGGRDKTEKKIKDAQNACKDLEKAAEKHKRKDVKEKAQEAGKELQKAQQENKKGNGEKAEEHLKKAMEKLKPSGKDKKDKDNQQQQQNKNNKDDQNKQEDKQPKQDQKLAKQDPNNDQKGSKDQQEKKDEKSIDPREAGALLDLMANDEKSLRDQIKENQKRNARVKKVLKDW